jgi:anaerobic magnesium-protoporphyrin IX monomethyl ester cyclase
MAKLLFIQNIEYEFLGPMYIAAFVAQRHQSRVAIGTSAEDFFSVMDEYQPDFIGFSVMTGNHLWAADTARRLKAAYSVTTVFGGAHPTFFPQFIDQDGVDIICRGEGEEAVADLLNAHDEGRDFSTIANLHVKLPDGSIVRNAVRALEPNLDRYPFPERTLYDLLDGRSERSLQHIITSRGCPYDCTFCFEKSMKDLYQGKGKYLRVRSMENVLAEILELKDKHGAKVIYFCDDVFGINTQWLYPFLEAYRAQVGMDFVCLVRADIIARHPEYAQKLRDAGCQTVYFGIETGSEETRNTVLNKRLTNEQIYRAAQLLHEAGIKFRTYNILGLPGETLKDAFETIRLNVRIKADYPWCSLFAPYPGTALASYAVTQGYLKQDFNLDSFAPSFFVNSHLNQQDIRSIENLQKFFQTAVLFPWTIPLIRRLIALPPNILFRLWFGMVYFFVYIASEERSFLHTLRFALRNARHTISKG